MLTYSGFDLDHRLAGLRWISPAHPSCVEWMAWGLASLCRWGLTVC